MIKEDDGLLQGRTIYVYVLPAKETPKEAPSLLLLRSIEEEHLSIMETLTNSQKTHRLPPLWNWLSKMKMESTIFSRFVAVNLALKVTSASTSWPSFTSLRR